MYSNYWLTNDCAREKLEELHKDASEARRSSAATSRKPLLFWLQLVS